jgi:hypothetical protein
LYRKVGGAVVIVGSQSQLTLASRQGKGVIWFNKEGVRKTKINNKMDRLCKVCFCSVEQKPANEKSNKKQK